MYIIIYILLCDQTYVLTIFLVRFEQPDDQFIKRYPRTIKNSVRQKDDKRKVGKTRFEFLTILS